MKTKFDKAIEKDNILMKDLINFQWKSRLQKKGEYKDREKEKEMHAKCSKAKLEKKSEKN